MHQAFLSCAAHVDLAQRAMIRCVPASARSLALPLAVGADTLRMALAEARSAMPSWRHPAVEQHWQQCSRALEETLAGVPAAVATAGATTELEQALSAVQSLLEPLHAFVEAERAFTRRRSRRSV